MVLQYLYGIIEKYIKNMAVDFSDASEYYQIQSRGLRILDVMHNII